MKTIEYTLEIYEPANVYDCCMTLSSSTPFMAISAGDIINPTVWNRSQSANEVYRVINVEHLIRETDSVMKHTVMVFTEVHKDTRELRLTRNS